MLVRSSIDLIGPGLTLSFLLEVENDRLRHIRLHERVNELPDPNYSTLKYFLGHLHRLSPVFPYFRKVLTIDEQDKPTVSRQLHVHL